MADPRGYYKTLGVSESASADDIKLAYRKLAMKWHPDRWVNGSDAEKKTAEEEFKKASEAYGVLGDADKKQKYDSGMDFENMGGFGGGGNPFQGMGLDDILSQMFGGGFSGFSGFGGFGGQRKSGPKVNRGQSIRTRVKLTLQEIANGCTKQVTLDRWRPCADCSGRGAKNASDVKTCTNCNGSGVVYVTRQSLFGVMRSESECPRCGGDGKTITNACPTCGGKGLVRKRETISVKIPAGVDDGMQITVQGEGHSGAHNGVNGDLLVVIETIENPDLKRDGDNIFYTRVISVTDAMLGCTITVPTIDGSQKVNLDPGTQSGTVKRLRGLGVPSVNRYGMTSGRGDMYVKILVWIPRKLDRSERKMIEELAASKSVQPDLNRDDREIFEKEKNIF